ncbi:helix-turn-helix domain-containing protein [Thiomonas sp.]
MTDTDSPRYGWRLAALMGEHKIRTGTELQRRLADVGYDITSSQITRIIYVRPQQVKTALLDALGEVFGCSMCDIMPVIEPGRAQQERDPIAPPERKKRVRPPKPAVTSESEEDMAGPVVRAFPLPKK